MHRRILSLLLCFFLLCPLAGAQAEVFTISLELKGQVWINAQEWKEKELFGSVDVYMDGERIGKLTASSFGSTELSVPAAGDVKLIPRMDSIDSGYIVEEEYIFPVSPDENRISILLNADSGFFRIEA